MPEPKTCPSCRTALPADATRGLCPACLLEAGLATGGAPPADDRVPTIEELAPKFPGLEIEALVGRGGMGVVYRARHKALDRQVALKVLASHVAAERAFADRFQREARALAKLQHPNIVAVHDFGQVVEEAGGGLFWLVMEYVDGVNVREAMRAGHIGPKEALAIVPQICDALQYAHEHGVVHRDIKPENILLDKAGRVKVADFGLAKLTDRAVADASLTGAGQVMGTLHYMAPEQWEHPKDVDHRADIYSLGVVFYEMLTGELPVGRFAAPSTKSAVDARIDEIVLRTLEREREARYQQVSQVKTDVGIVTASPAPAAPVAAPADVQVTQVVQTGLGHGLRGQLVLGAILTAAGAVWWAVRDRELVWTVLPLAGLAIMALAVLYRLRQAAPVQASRRNAEFAVGALLVAAGIMAKLAPVHDERDQLASLAIAVGWLMAAFGAPALLAATRWSPSNRKFVAVFFAVIAAAAGIWSAGGLVWHSKFPEHEPAPADVGTARSDAPAAARNRTLVERPAYDPAESDAAFAPNFSWSSCIAEVDPEVRGMKQAWAKLAQAVASGDVHAGIELYRPEDREALREFERTRWTSAGTANLFGDGSYGVPYWAIDMGAESFSKIRMSQASATTFPDRGDPDQSVSARITATTNPGSTASVFTFEMAGRVHEDAAGRWTEWFFQRDGFHPPAGSAPERAPAVGSSRTADAPARDFEALDTLGGVASISADDRERIASLWERVQRLPSTASVDEAGPLYPFVERSFLADRLEKARAGDLGLPLLLADRLPASRTRFRLTRVEFELGSPATGAVAVATNGTDDIWFRLARYHVGDAQQGMLEGWSFDPSPVIIAKRNGVDPASSAARSTIDLLGWLRRIPAPRELKRLSDLYSDQAMKRLWAMPAEEPAKMGAGGDLGLPLMSETSLGAPLSDFHVERVATSQDGRSAEVWLNHATRGYRVSFRVVREGAGAWRFTTDPAQLM
jgi:tRNA A-37 threonylcarbamoyl transferase component Bud32